MDGDVSGGALIPVYSARVEECQEDCDTIPDCHSFTHSATKGECKLLSALNPTTGMSKGYQFCKKRKFYMAHTQSLS